jgi:hypothetical protein
VLLHSPGDYEVAADLAAPGNIGTEKSWLRWEAMRRGAALHGGPVTVSLTAAHSGVLAPSSEANRNWNLHTLTLMELAGMIRLHWTRVTAVPDGLSEEGLAAYFDAHFQKVHVEVLQSDLDNEEVFKARLTQTRKQSGDASAASLASVIALIGHETCYNQMFARAYALHQPNGDVVHVDVRCGGCPTCRRAGLAPWSDRTVLSPPYVSRATSPVPSPLRGLFRSHGECSITFDSQPRTPWGELEALLGRLIEGGVRLLVLPVDARRVIERLHRRTLASWFATETLEAWFQRDRPPPMVTAVVLPPGTPEVQVGLLLRHRSETNALLVVHDFDQCGPPDSKHQLREIIRPSIDVATAMGRI